MPLMVVHLKPTPEPENGLRERIPEDSVGD
jgi:hypothetical protein